MDEKQFPTPEELSDLLARLGLSDAVLKQFRSEEGGNPYAVWLVQCESGIYVLKRAKSYETEAYRCFFAEKKPYAPALFGSVRHGENDYLLLEYCPGKDLRHCERDNLIKALDALAAMQEEFWQREELYGTACTMEIALEAIERRGTYLDSAQLEAVFAQFKQVYQQTPRSLCHDDLLPINVLVDERAVLIDWEYAGVLPYLSSFARLIAHGREEKDAYLYMSREDRDFAIDYYYAALPQKHGISYQEYRRSLDYFLFYEYCEWIMIGNRFDMKEDERYLYCLKQAEALADQFLCQT